ncbi:interleukin-22 receptor subunit alpha-2 [Odontesthes bonariensis]|uniref:interleukin-22 receptor subunit alpha-2 n=1 Tax=Odontesthes bonariensis TaxID=219752 RepID=UPI003F58AB84
MSRLLLGAVLLGNLAFCGTAQELLAPPAQVRFDSMDYRHILHWTPSNKSSSLQYNVQWKIYGEREWLDVDSCQGTQKLQCNLSSVTSDTREWYYARVSAVGPSSRSAWALSARFSPRWNTKISPPALRLSSNKQGIVVHVKPPRVLARKMRSSLHYKIYVLSPSEEEEVIHMDCCSNKLTLTTLKHKTKYCLQAQTGILLHAKSSARSPVACITTP